jgi:trigger factor
LNIQTERQENHVARVTVELDAERLEAAKQQAAKRLSNRLNIPGFRKGKAPYRIVVKYVGEGAVVEEALDTLGEQIYKEVLPQTGIEPYGPGSLEDVKLEDKEKPTFIYTVPLVPEVDLGDYRSLRVDFELPEVKDSDVDRSLRLLQEQNAVAEDSQRAAELGNRVTLDIHSFFVEEHEAEDDDEKDDDEDEHEEHDHEHEEHDHDHNDEPQIDHSHGEHFIHEHDFVTLLNDDYEPIKGFNEVIAGMNVGDKKEFELTVPDDDDEEEMRGRKVKFEVTVKKVENFTMPALNDDLAARATKDDEKPLTLLELRMRTRENLVEANERHYRSEYANNVLDKVVEGATIHYPEAVVNDEIDRTLQRFDQQLRQQNRMTLNDYLKITQSSIQQLYPQFRPQAVRTVERALAMRELLDAEGIAADDHRVNQEIDKIVESYDADRREAIRGLFDRAEMRESVKDDVLTQTLMDRLVAIAKGEAPALPEANEKPEVGAIAAAKVATELEAKALDVEQSEHNNIESAGENVESEVTEPNLSSSGDETENKGE